MKSFDNKDTQFLYFDYEITKNNQSVLEKILQEQEKR